MWMDAYVEETLIRDRIAEAERVGARRQLLRNSRRAPAQRHRPSVMQHFVDVISILWLKGRKERKAVR